MQTNAVGWFEIYVSDMARAQAFYEAVLATRLKPLAAPNGPASDLQMLHFGGDDEASMSRYGANGALVKMAGVEPGGIGTVVYFSCEDCGVEAGRVAKAGGRIFKDKFAIGEYGFCALAYDTEGNLFGLHSMQ
ncbi:MAG: lactoylglutathione lyase [Pseudoxanthomonas suwonensis]|nr:MAG: lactoylglutathione lyase [Pseudoxanthomonas suwonensis]